MSPARPHEQRSQGERPRVPPPSPRPPPSPSSDALSRSRGDVTPLRPPRHGLRRSPRAASARPRPPRRPPPTRRLHVPPAQGRRRGPSRKLSFALVFPFSTALTHSAQRAPTLTFFRLRNPAATMLHVHCCAFVSLEFKCKSFILEKSIPLTSIFSANLIAFFWHFECVPLLQRVDPFVGTHLHIQGVSQEKRLLGLFNCYVTNNEMTAQQ